MIREPIFCGNCGGGVDESVSHCPWCSIPLRMVQVDAKPDRHPEKWSTMRPVEFNCIDALPDTSPALEAMGMEKPKLDFNKTHVREPGKFEIQCWPQGIEKPHYIAKLMNEPGNYWQLLSTVGIEHSPSHEFDNMRKFTYDLRIKMDSQEECGRWPTRPQDTTFDERIEQISTAINSLGDYVMVRNWNDIQQALTPDMSTEATGIGRITHREYYFRNQMLRKVCDLLRRKEYVILFVNCNKDVISTVARINAGTAWHVPIPDFMRYLFTVDESRLT